jgi:hypothetical protein
MPRARSRDVLGVRELHCLHRPVALALAVPPARTVIASCPTRACNGRNLASLGFAAEACYVGRDPSAKAG